jgi:hypothetical protein
MTKRTKIILAAVALLVIAIYAIAQNMQTYGITTNPTVFAWIGAIPTDPCESSVINKLNVFANITTATTTALVPVSGTTAVYVCSYQISMVATVAADTILFEQGTGSACSGSPTALSATISSGIMANGSTQINMDGGSDLMTTAPGNGLCVVTTVGTGPAIGVTVSYVQR